MGPKVVLAVWDVLGNHMQSHVCILFGYMVTAVSQGDAINSPVNQLDIESAHLQSVCVCVILLVWPSV
jgi:hypothetical protein